MRKWFCLLLLLVAENEPATTVAGTLFRTNNVGNAATAGNDEEAVRENILKGAKIIACSGYTNDEEKPDFLLDGKTDTKWCDVSQTPELRRLRSR